MRFPNCSFFSTITRRTSVSENRSAIQASMPATASSGTLSTMSSIFSSNPVGVNSPAFTNAVMTSSSPMNLLQHFCKVLTSGGRCRDDIVARVNSRLKQRYGVDDPMAVAVEAVKPVLKYQRFKHSRQHVPIVLQTKSAEGIAIRWIVNAAHNRQYLGKRNLERGLFDEIDGVLLGNSSVYQKRLNFHRNPN